MSEKSVNLNQCINQRMNNLSDPIEIIDLRHTLLSHRKDGIIVLQCNDNHTYSKEEIIENHETIRKLSPHQKAFVLTIAGRYTSIEPEAKKYTAAGRHESFIGAEAFVIHNLAQRILAQFYFKINKPIVASEYFTDLNKAEKWILQQKINYEKNNL